MKKLKILQIIQFYSPQMGGPVHNVHNLSRKLIEFGHDVTVCTTDYKYDESFSKSVPRLKAVVFPSRAGYLRYSPQMKDWLEDHVQEYDVVHLNNYWSYQNIIASRIAKMKGVPYILSPRGSLLVQMKNYIIKYLYDLLFGKQILKNVSMVVATTPMEEAQIKNKGSFIGCVAVIPNAVNLPPENLDSDVEFKRKYNIQENEKIVLFLARIHKMKGVDLMIDAFSDLLLGQNDVKLVIVGPDEGYLENVKKTIKMRGISSSVTLTGPLFNRDKYLAYTSASLYVLPSRYEIFGNTILEACACGIPVIITDRCGIAPVIVDKAGEVVKFNRKDLLSSMKKLLASPELCRAYGEYGKKLVKQNYVWDKVAKQYEELYYQVSKMEGQNV